MRNKVLKKAIVILILMTLMLSNFLFLGVSAISYAADNSTTNHPNVLFDAYFKDGDGNKVTSLESGFYDELSLYVNVNVKKEGYFNGEINLSNSNFKLKDVKSDFVKKLEDNKITLNQINAGAAAEIEVKVEPIKKETYAVGLFNISSDLDIAGQYKDSTEKDIQIQAKRNVNLNMTQDFSNEEVVNQIDFITNKIEKVNGEEKRVVQFSFTVGLQDNQFPIKNILSNIELPKFENENIEVYEFVAFNTMRKYDFKQEDNMVTILMDNQADEQGNIQWKQGEEKIILTCVYDKNTTINTVDVSAKQKITMYDDKEIETMVTKQFENEEKDNIIEVSMRNAENNIYKGKLYAGVDRKINSKTEMKVNFAQIANGIELQEKRTVYTLENSELDANVIYEKTVAKKEDILKVLGEAGTLTIYNQEGQVIGVVNKDTEVDENGNAVITYENAEVKEIVIKTTAPESVGTISLNHTKTIKGSDKHVIQEAKELKTTAVWKGNEIQNVTTLENTKSEARLEGNRDTLSTVVNNNLTLKAVLKSNNEQLDLYKNPQLVIELPEQVENINLNSIDLIYENQLQIKHYEVNGRTIRIILEGEQTEYKEATIEGANIVLNMDVTLNRKAATSTEAIHMAYYNQNAVAYAEGDTVGHTQAEIKVVAPRDVTAINSIQDLGIETVGETEEKEVLLPRGQNARQVESQMELINNNENPIEHVTMIGAFPTDNKENNLGVNILEDVQVENAKIYYTENEEATEDLSNENNAWTENRTENAKKYLLVVDRIESGASVNATYKMQIPENLEYNQSAKTQYRANYTNATTRVAGNAEATKITLDTGVGPQVETKMSATVGGKAISGTVKNGEVIKFTVKVKNTGTEEAKDVSVQAMVPEGTKLVTPVADFEYAGSVYYQEHDDTTYQAKIGNLTPGQEIVTEYEVRVNKDTTAGKELISKAQVKYADVIKDSEEVKTTVGKAEIRATVKRITDRKIEIYQGQPIKYYAIIENMTDKKMENVIVKANLVGNLEIVDFALVRDLDSGETMEQLEYSEQVTIPSLEAGEAVALSYTGNVPAGVSKVGLQVNATHNNIMVLSNLVEDEAKTYHLDMTMTSNVKEKNVKSGDKITYTIEVNNTSDVKVEKAIVDVSVPEQLTINSLHINGTEEEVLDSNLLNISFGMEPNAKTTIVIDTVVDYSEARTQAEAIVNKAILTDFLGKEFARAEITHIIQSNDAGQGNNGGGNNGGDVAEGTRTISGLAWFDENTNGIKDSNEETLNNVKAKLLNVDTNNFVRDTSGAELEVTTNQNGIYILENITDGNYIVVFEYNQTEYALTKYNAGAAEDSSKAMMNEIQINGETRRVASTDMIEIQDNDIADINIGLIKMQNFDLKLDKHVRKIIVQNAKGITVREYNNETMAKLELDAKQIAGTTVTVEYDIKVSNVGEVEGYAKSIVDYMPNDFVFNAEANKDWYQSENADSLITTSLANEKIAPGETKVVKLTLTKTMTESNTGLSNNTAEITEDFNELGLADSNSTPGNREQGENDLGSADVIISIRTGGAVYITLGIVIGLIIIAGVLTIIYQSNKKMIRDEI